jgi:hypothetical protein
MKDNGSMPGLTPTAVSACLLAMMGMGMLIQYSDITIGMAFASEHTLALPAIWVFMALSLICGAVYLSSRWRILSRAEMLCVMYCMLISAPLMTQGFWHRIVAVLATNPRMADFEKLDAMNDRLWPHGPNVLTGALRQSNPDLHGAGTVVWESIEYDADLREVLPTLVNAGGTNDAALRLRLPVKADGKAGIVPGEPFVMSILVRATELGPESRYYCRVYADDQPAFTEFFSGAAGPKVNFLHRTGFQRVGAYGVKFPEGARDYCTLELGLDGNGRVEFADPKLLSVIALESLYKGRLQVSEAEYAAAPPAQQVYMLAKPDRMWSWRGLCYILKGYIPVRDWAGPVAVWTLFILLILSATLAINIIMRRQWLDSERFQLPMARIPAMLLDDGESRDRAMSAIWANRVMWAGFATALVWMLLRAWHGYNPKVPDVSVKVVMKEYFRDASWGAMFSRWQFEIDGIFLSLCIFMELNVLLSLVVGYMGFKSLSWIGEVGGLTADPNYPYTDSIGMGSYVGYAAILIILSRRYLWGTLKAAVRGEGPERSTEALSYRGAYGMLILSLLGSIAWAHWLGISPGGMFVFVAFLVTLGFVAARLRAECGTPWGYFLPYNIALFIGLLGGVWRFGSEAVLFCYIASFMLAPTVFYLIPGAQMELLGLGKRWNVRPRDLVLCATLGVLGGMIIGGWVFLSNAYAIGGDNLSRYEWAFDSKWWYFFPYNLDVTVANNRMLGQQMAQTGVNPAWTVFGVSAGLAVVVTLLRQFLSGFWFHPIGLLLCSTNFLDYIWGSALTAWAIRLVALRLGGAATVREKLHPFFVGVFLGTCTAYLLILVHGAYLKSQGFGGMCSLLSPPV